MLYLWKDSALQNWRDAIVDTFNLEDIWLLGIQMSKLSNTMRGCNIFRGGEQFRFAMNLDAKYGEGRAEELF
jgi:hypothetical protein